MLSKFGVGEDPDDFLQSGAVSTDEGKESVTEDMLEPGAPGVAVEFLEDGDDGRDDEFLVLFLFGLKEI